MASRPLLLFGGGNGVLRGCAMPDYRIFVLKEDHIKEPAKIISCPDDEAATEQTLTSL